MDWAASPGDWVGRVLFQRGLAGIYLLAFLGSALQFRALLGDGGIMPIRRYVAAVPFRTPPASSTSRTPTASSPSCRGWAWPSRPPSSSAWATWSRCRRPWPCGPSPGPSTCRSSTSGSGGTRSGGSRSCCEAGFLAIFLGPPTMAPPVLVLWLLRWLLFRLELGRRAHQAAGRPVLARPDLPPVPPRDPAAAEPAELVVPPPARRSAPGRGGGQPRHPAGRAVPPARPAARRRAWPRWSWSSPRCGSMLSGNFAWLNALTIVHRPAGPGRLAARTDRADRSARRPGRPAGLVRGDGGRGARRRVACSASGRCATSSHAEGGSR